MLSAWVPTWESRGENYTAKVENYKVRRGIGGWTDEWSAEKERVGVQTTPEQLDGRREKMGEKDSEKTERNVWKVLT